MHENKNSKIVSVLEMRELVGSKTRTKKVWNMQKSVLAHSKTCKRCGRPFVTKARHQFFCCPKCWYNKTNSQSYTQEAVGITCAICDASFTVRPSRGKSARYCSYRCHQIAAGRMGGAVTGAMKKASSNRKTYVKFKGRHIHRLIAEQKLNRPLRIGEVVHHVNGNKLDNRANNIEILNSQSEHIKLHLQEMLRIRKEIHGY